jgi:uncharacterized protein YcaQ
VAHNPPSISREAVIRLWMQRQGLVHPRGTEPLTRKAFIDHLERTGALQLDSVNVVDRAHYLTLWSRFGAYDRARLDRWTYRDKVAFEYWGHEASILPISHLPFSRRRMSRFPGRWLDKSWWSRYDTSMASRRRVLRRLRAEGPLESTDFERQPHEDGVTSTIGESMMLPKEDKRSLKLLWHRGKIAVHSRRHFRCVYDLSERVYPEALEGSEALKGAIATGAEWEDTWLLRGLSGNGVAGEKHLINYFTSPELKAAERRKVIARNLKYGRIAEVRIDGARGPFYALPELLDGLDAIPEPHGTTLICPFDSFLFQRKRAEELLDFTYRIEIYVPEPKREYGYYVLPILHEGKLVGRVDPKLHRDRGLLQIKALHLEPGFKSNSGFVSGMRETLSSLAEFLGATDLEVPRGWKKKLG